MDIIRLENVQFLCKKLISRPNLLLPQQKYILDDIVYCWLTGSQWYWWVVVVLHICLAWLMLWLLPGCGDILSLVMWCPLIRLSVSGWLPRACHLTHSANLINHSSFMSSTSTSPSKLSLPLPSTSFTADFNRFFSSSYKNIHQKLLDDLVLPSYVLAPIFHFKIKYNVHFMFHCFSAWYELLSQSRRDPVILSVTSRPAIRESSDQSAMPIES